MTDPKTYWLTDGQDHYALVTGAEERDRWIPLGWTLVDAEPVDAGRVWAWHDGVELPAAFPANIFRDLWEPRGWQAGPPPGSPHPFAALPAPVETPKSSTTAVGGDPKKEKTGA